MLKINQVVIVEGRYDKAKLSSIIDATILTTDGFDIYRDREKLRLIKTLAKKHGIVILTDSDAAGFQIRAHIAGAVSPDEITHVYIPDVLGKERRKAQFSAEGKLGVEGIPKELLLQAFEKAGITAVETGSPKPAKGGITKADLMQWGLCGGEGSAELRRAVLKKLKLPSRMNASAMLNVLNTLYTHDEFETLLKEL